MAPGSLVHSSYPLLARGVEPSYQQTWPEDVVSGVARSSTGAVTSTLWSRLEERIVEHPAETRWYSRLLVRLAG